jgi:demethylmenaquinone methyltransferase/2-methoxy-6-polyprenyl-1,4-benzoquinol methylase
MGLLVGWKKTLAWFDIISPIYNFINPLIYTQDMRSRLLSEVKGGRVLDVGVGTGYTTAHIKNAIGIDINLNMLRQAVGNYQGSLALGDALYAPFKAQSFDTILSAGSLYYFADPLEALRLFNGLLKPQGVFMSITPSLRVLKPLVHIFGHADLQRLFEDGGFKVEVLENLRGIANFCKGRKIS